jgi:hypothetical protein
MLESPSVAQQARRIKEPVSGVVRGVDFLTVSHQHHSYLRRKKFLGGTISDDRS